MNKQLLTNIAVGVGSAGLGAGVAYFFTKRKIFRLMDEEIEKVRDHYRLVRKDDYDTPEQMVHANRVFNDVVQQQGYNPMSDVDGLAPDVQELDEEEEAPEETRNIFERIADHEAEYQESTQPDISLPARIPNKPYIISYEEFMEDDDYTKVSVSYFEEDETLCDERDQLIPDIMGTVGKENLDYFGALSEQEDIVLVRNTVLGVDYEILRREGTFSEKVLGIPNWDGHDIQDDGPRVKRMRSSDE